MHTELTFFQFPKTTAEWKNIALNFQEGLNFPHCLGAVNISMKTSQKIRQHTVISEIVEVPTP